MTVLSALTEPAKIVSRPSTAAQLALRSERERGGIPASGMLSKPSINERRALTAAFQRARLLIGMPERGAMLSSLTARRSEH